MKAENVRMTFDISKRSYTRLKSTIMLMVLKFPIDWITGNMFLGKWKGSGNS